jgi:hypothetical protein
MKFVSKFKLEILLAWKGCVAPGHNIFDRIKSSIFPLDNLETLII